MNPRVDEIAEDEIDDTVLSAEGHGWFGTFFGEGIKPSPFPSGKDYSEYAQSHMARPLCNMGISIRKGIGAGQA
jgi:hypothetical protein